MFPIDDAIMINELHLMTKPGFCVVWWSRRDDNVENQSWDVKCINTLRARQGCRHFCRWHFHMHYLERKLLNYETSLKYVPRDLIYNKLSLVQITGCRRTGDKPWSEPMMVWFTDADMRHSQPQWNTNPRKLSIAQTHVYHKAFSTVRSHDHQGVSNHRQFVSFFSS